MINDDTVLKLYCYYFIFTVIILYCINALGDLEYSNFWVNTDKVKTRLSINDVIQPVYMPINSLDIQKQQLICGADNEAVYFQRNLKL